MKHLVCSAWFVALGLALAACQSTNDATAHVDVTWTLELSGSGVAQTTCPAGDDTAALYTQPVDGSNNPIGKPIIDLMECAAGSGASAALPPGVYNEWVVIEDHAATMPAAQSPTTLDLNGQPLILGNEDVTISEYIVLDGGYFEYEWNLIGATSGSAVSCQHALADTISMTAVNVQNSASTFTSTSPCSNDATVHLTLTNPIPTGLYTVQISALAAGGSAVGPVATLDNQMIQAPSALMPVTQLGQVNIEVNGM